MLCWQGWVGCFVVSFVFVWVKSKTCSCFFLDEDFVGSLTRALSIRLSFEHLLNIWWKQLWHSFTIWTVWSHPFLHNCTQFWLITPPMYIINKSGKNFPIRRRVLLPAISKWNRSFVGVSLWPAGEEWNKIHGVYISYGLPPLHYLWQNL